MTRIAVERALPTQLSTEPIQAWRAWALSGRRDGSNLQLRPVAGRSKAWPPDRPAEAVCKLGWFHDAPHAECTCGLHGTHGPDLLRRTRSPAVLGRVALWGRVIEHELGYRGRFGYPQRVRLVCQFCFWQWGAIGPAPSPSVVGWFPREELVPMCDVHVEIAHRYGMRPRALLDGPDVDQALRATYRVDPLPS
jgi:hypothetical protein